MVNKTVHGDSYEYEYKYETQTTSGRDIRTPFERRYGSSTQFTAAGIGHLPSVGIACTYAHACACYGNSARNALMGLGIV